MEEKKIERLSSKPFKKLNLFSFFYPRRPNERKTREKPKKKDRPNSLSVSQNFAAVPFFLFPPSTKIRVLFWESFLFIQYERGLKYVGFGFAWRPSR